MKTKEAKFYHQLANGKVVCNLCPHHCVLKEKQMSPCGSRMLIDGKLYALSYGNVVAQQIDPVEKKPLYHFMPGEYTYSIGTPGCNLHCKNCQNSTLSQSDNIKIRGDIISPEQVVQQAKVNHCQSIAYTYSEPTIFYEFMLDTAKLAHKAGIKNIMISNGYISEDAMKLLLPYIDAVNIDMKVFSDNRYKQISGASLKPVLSSILAIKKANVHLEISILCIPGISDDENLIKEFVVWLEKHDMLKVPLHISRFFPSYKLSHIPACPESKLYDLVNSAKERMYFVYPGNVQSNEMLNLDCYKCGERLITRIDKKTQAFINQDGSCPKCGEMIIPTYQGSQIH